MIWTSLLPGRMASSRKTCSWNLWHSFIKERFWPITYQTPSATRDMYRHLTWACASMMMRLIIESTSSIILLSSMLLHCSILRGVACSTDLCGFMLRSWASSFLTRDLPFGHRKEELFGKKQYRFVIQSKTFSKCSDSTIKLPNSEMTEINDQNIN